MRYTEAWSSVVYQNLSLKIVSLVLGSVCLSLTLISAKLAFEEPILIERGCVSKLISRGESIHSAIEIESFLRLALSQRFETGVQPGEFVTEEQVRIREAEQKQFKARKIRQVLIVNSTEKNGEWIDVDADRLISVGDVRSAFRFPLQVQLTTTTRTSRNPYGLILANVRFVEKSSDDKKVSK